MPGRRRGSTPSRATCGGDDAFLSAALRGLRRLCNRVGSHAVFCLSVLVFGRCRARGGAGDRRQHRRHDLGCAERDAARRQRVAAQRGHERPAADRDQRRGRLRAAVRADRAIHADRDAERVHDDQARGHRSARRRSPAPRSGDAGRRAHRRSDRALGGAAPRHRQRQSRPGDQPRAGRGPAAARPQPVHRSRSCRRACSTRRRSASRSNRPFDNGGMDNFQISGGRALHQRVPARRRAEHRHRDEPAQQPELRAVARRDRRIQGADEHLRRAVRPHRRRRRQRRAEERHQPVPRRGLRVLPGREAEREHVRRQPRRQGEGGPLLEPARPDRRRSGEDSRPLQRDRQDVLHVQLGADPQRGAVPAGLHGAERARAHRRLLAVADRGRPSHHDLRPAHHAPRERPEHPRSVSGQRDPREPHRSRGAAAAAAGADAEHHRPGQQLPRARERARRSLRPARRQGRSGDQRATIASSRATPATSAPR